MKVRKLLRVTHRDIGYFFAVLTIIYSVSGIAVNHVNDWNPNYILERKEVTFTPVTDSTIATEKLVERFTEEFNINAKYLSEFKSSPTNIDIFYDKTTFRADLIEGTATIEIIKSRPVFRIFNFLHLNVPKAIWTWVADIFALSLIILALTGIFMNKGQKGFSGRGKWLVGLGLLLPVIFILLYY